MLLESTRTVYITFKTIICIILQLIYYRFMSSYKQNVFEINTFTVSYYFLLCVGICTYILSLHFIAAFCHSSVDFSTESTLTVLS